MIDQVKGIYNYLKMVAMAVFTPSKVVPKVEKKKGKKKTTKKKPAKKT